MSGNKRLGDQCISHKSCASGFCQLAKCTNDAGIGSPCSESSTCSLGLVCHETRKRCLPTSLPAHHPCLSDYDCTREQYCSREGLSSVCRARRPLNEKCLNTDQCQDGLECYAGKCLQRCTADSECESFGAGLLCERLAPFYSICIDEASLMTQTKAFQSKSTVEDKEHPILETPYSQTRSKDADKSSTPWNAPSDIDLSGVNLKCSGAGLNNSRELLRNSGGKLKTSGGNLRTSSGSASNTPNYGIDPPPEMSSPEPEQTFRSPPPPPPLHSPPPPPAPSAPQRPPSSTPTARSHAWLWAGIGAGIIILVLLVVCVFLMIKRRRAAPRPIVPPPFNPYTGGPLSTYPPISEQDLYPQYPHSPYSSPYITFSPSFMFNQPGSPAEY